MPRSCHGLYLCQERHHGFEFGGKGVFDPTFCLREDTKQCIVLLVFEPLKIIVFHDYFTPVTNIQRYHTRYSSGYFISFAHTNCRKKSIKYIGPRLWNSLVRLKEPSPSAAYSLSTLLVQPLHWLVISNYWV